MSKPEDIREQAKRIYFERCDEVSRLAHQFEEEEVIDLLARAILAAKAEEREACAQVADEHSGPFAEGSIFGAGETFAANKIAAAIRKRGEVNTAHKNSEVQ